MWNKTFNFEESILQVYTQYDGNFADSQAKERS